MRSRFSFQTAHESDWKSYQIADPRKDVTIHKPISTGEKRPSSMSVKRCRTRSEISYENQEEQQNLRDQFIKLSTEISELKEEIIPLRKHRTDLERMLLDRDRKFVQYNQVFAPNERLVPYDEIKHYETEAIMSARREQNFMKNEKKYLNDLTNDKALQYLYDEVLKERDKLKIEREASMKRQEEIDSMQDKIHIFKLSTFPIDIKEQKKRIENLRSKIIRQIEYRKRLKFERNALKDLHFPKTPEEIENQPYIQDLLKQYEKVKDSTLVVGFFDWPVRASEIRNMFKSFGPIQNIVMHTNYSLVSFKHRNDAVVAAVSLDGMLFRDKPLIIRFSTDRTRARCLKSSSSSNFNNPAPPSRLNYSKSQRSLAAIKTQTTESKKSISSGHSDLFEEDESNYNLVSSSSKTEERTNSRLESMMEEINRKKEEIDNKYKIQSPKADANNSSNQNPRRSRNLASKQLMKSESNNSRHKDKSSKIEKKAYTIDSDIYIERIIEPSHSNSSYATSSSPSDTNFSSSSDIFSSYYDTSDAEKILNCKLKTEFNNNQEANKNSKTKIHKNSYAIEEFDKPDSRGETKSERLEREEKELLRLIGISNIGLKKKEPVRKKKNQDAKLQNQKQENIIRPMFISESDSDPLQISYRREFGNTYNTTKSQIINYDTNSDSNDMKILEYINLKYFKSQNKYNDLRHQMKSKEKDQEILKVESDRTRKNNNNFHGKSVFQSNYESEHHLMNQNKENNFEELI